MATKKGLHTSMLVYTQRVVGPPDAPIASGQHGTIIARAPGGKRWKVLFGTDNPRVLWLDSDAIDRLPA
jgi:hypothetical protein